MTVVAIPYPLPGTAAAWRKTITVVDVDGQRGYAVGGVFVTPGGRYAVAGGGLILGVDRRAEDTAVTVWRITGGGLVELRQIVRKGPWAGRGTLKTLARLLAAHPWTGGRPVQVAAAANLADGWCRRCGRLVPAGAGVQFRNRDGQTTVAHRACPPPLNRHPGWCATCAGWLLPGEGMLAGRDPLTGRWAVAHPVRGCPPPERRRPAPQVRNRWEGPCRRCGWPVGAGRGVYVRVVPSVRGGSVGWVRHLPGGCPGRAWTWCPIPRPIGGRRPAGPTARVRPARAGATRRVVRRRRGAPTTHPDHATLGCCNR